MEKTRNPLIFAPSGDTNHASIKAVLAMHTDQLTSWTENFVNRQLYFILCSMNYSEKKYVFVDDSCYYINEINPINNSDL